MDNRVESTCRACGAANAFLIAEAADEAEMLHCAACGAGVASVGQLHAEIAQQALGLGATELRDDHVPVDGELGERPGI